MYSVKPVNVALYVVEGKHAGYITHKQTAVSSTTKACRSTKTGDRNKPE